MAVLVYSDIVNAIQDLVQSSASTDNPLTADATFLPRIINRAYRTVWQLSGGAYKTVSSATAWTNAQSATGTVQGILTDIEEVLHVFAISVSPQTISCTTASSTTLTAAVAGTFASGGTPIVTAGMTVSGGTKIPSGTTVASYVDSSTLTLSQAGTGIETASFTFSPPYATSSSGTELNRADLAQIQALRSSTAYGTYSVPKIYAVSRLDTTTPGNVGKLQLDYWPGLTGFYFATHYVPILTPLDASTVTTPNVTDIESEDIAYLAAAECAPLLGRAELVPSIMARLSERTALALERRKSALLEGKQDK